MWETRFGPSPVKRGIAAFLGGGIAMFGVYLLKDPGLVKLSIKLTILGGNIIGGLLFGVRWGLFGYCPGTAVGALGEGHWDTVWGLLGMFAGTGIFTEVYPFLKTSVLKWGDFGKIIIPTVPGVNHWVVILVFVAGGLLLFR